MASTHDLAGELTALLGASRVSGDEAVRDAHGTDKWFASARPDVVVFPESTEEVAELLRFCHARRVPVTPRGAGVGYVGGCVPEQAGVSLSLSRMAAIREIDPRDGVAVVAPGVVTGDLQDAAKALGWFYPPDPASLRECSIGGNIATNAGGPRCLKYGVTRHYVLGLEAVLADGTVLRTGGRCHKNKTGFDLVGLFVGSEGMLGVVTEATLRLIPHPPARAMIGAGFSTFPEAADAVQRILGSGFLPAALEITDGFTLRAARDFRGPEMVPDGNAHLMLEIDGQPDSVRLETGRIADRLRDWGALDLEIAATEENCEALWALRRDFSYSLRATGLTKLNEDVVVPRSRLVDLVTFAQALQEETGIPVACFGHAGDGNIHVNLMVANLEDDAVRAHADAALDRLFRQVLAWGGAITGEHGIGIAKRRWFAEAVGDAGVTAHRALKAAFDPEGILNPGKFLGFRATGRDAGGTEIAL